MELQRILHGVLNKSRKKHPTAPVQPLTTHFTYYPIKMRKAYWLPLEK